MALNNLQKYIIIGGISAFGTPFRGRKSIPSWEQRQLAPSYTSWRRNAVLQRPEVKISEGDVKETSVIAGALLLRTACRLHAAAERVNIHDNKGWI